MIKCIVAVAIFICFDIITGLMSAFKKGNFKSSTMRRGLIAKTGEIFAVLLFLAIEKVLPFIGITITIPLVQAITVYIVIMEIGSIIENIGKMNQAVAKLCQNIFDEFKNTIGGDKDDKRN